MTNSTSKGTEVIDAFLAAALRDDVSLWPETWGDDQQDILVERALYHGVAGLLVAAPGRMAGWPVADDIRAQALGQAMWEIRHRLVLKELFDALGAAGIAAILLKGTALAYDIYDDPALRARGDTDLLVGEGDLARTRKILEETGFALASDEGQEAGATQQVWSRSLADGTEHDIDLHWQALHMPALEHLLTWEECRAKSRALPLLHPKAHTLGRTDQFLHAAIHRAQHITSPYFLGSVAFHGGDRLIWAYDLHLLAGRFDADDWSILAATAEEKGLADICLAGLDIARERLGTQIPDEILDRLRAASRPSLASHYLLGSRQLGRSWQDLRAQRGWRRKAAYLKAQTLPSSAFMRAKYPGMEHWALPFLHLRRMVELVRRRPGRSAR